MRHRRPVPQLFGLSMIDVFCCTLGCVTLLWLVNQRELLEKTRSAETTSVALTTAAARRDALAVELAAERARADDLARRATELRAELSDANDRLSKLTEAERSAVDQLAAARARIDTLAAAELSRREELETLTRREAELAAELNRRKAAADELAARAGAADRVRGELDRSIKSLEHARERVATLEERLAEAVAAIRKAETERDRMAGQVDRLRDAAENRFEGIALGGRRVVFLVDMSGSMKDVAEHEPSPGKWPLVADTVGRLIQSLPEMDRFQLILFSTGVEYPLLGPGRWIERSPESAATVRAALAKIEPKGATNLYAAFEAAFALRDQGLDTIYLISDGLPTIGEPLSVNDSANNNPEKGRILSKHLLTTLRLKWNKPDAAGSRVRIHAVGFYYESADLGTFLWSLARDHDGSFVGMSRP